MTRPTHFPLCFSTSCLLLSLMSCSVAQADNDGWPCTSGTSTADMNECLTSVAKEVDEELHRYLKVAQASLDQGHEQFPDEVKKIDLSEESAAWKEYVSTYCRHVYDSYGTGSLRDSAARRCYVDLTKERTHRIWEDFIATPDSSAPALPEPKI
ncbi:lysozyme inhibitor LprI family protein [Salinicola halophyticus]|uniref:lysozyme inhibitor LprI family protein n=1 Tax=Salinicola halophyticus TaxID=1808881 RepID=UPI000DA25BDE|nr:lysozyme inhibitor LprI family protein [Salinicola halophyticus]